jgi:hypothetical protein
MPAQRLDGSPCPVNKFDILAISDDVEDGLMTHAALSLETLEATNATPISFIHMGPPFGTRTLQLDSTLQFDAVGSCELTGKQLVKIKEFIDRQWADRRKDRKRLAKLGLKQEPRAQYRIQPPYSRPNKGSTVIRYSCVGFVMLAYKKARIELVSGPRPLKTIEQLKQLYPFASSLLDDADEREYMGLGNGDRWPVMLVGYVLHAMDRPPGEISGEDAKPYLPKEGDEYFPRKQPVKSSKAPTTT